MHKYPIELQDEEKACGAYCISMILKYFGFKEEIKRIKKNARLNQFGISIKGMIECLKKYQIEAEAYQASLLDVCQNNQYPCILYMVYNGIGHFVVLYEVKESMYIIGDPARGLMTIYEEELLENYGMMFISILHVGRVPEKGYKTYFDFLKETFLSYHTPMKKLIWKGILISLLGYASSYFFQFFIDDIHQDTKFFYVMIICGAYGLSEMIKNHLESQKNKETLALKRILDEDYVFQSSMNMLELPLSFFEQDKGYLQSELLSLFDLSEMSVTCFERVFLDGLSLVIFMIGMMFIDALMGVCICIMFLIIGGFTLSRLKALQKLHKKYLEAYFVYQHHLLELIENQFLLKRHFLLKRQRERSYRLFLDESIPKEKEGLMLNQIQISIHYIVIFFYVFIMLLGVYQFQKNIITIGQLMMFYMLVSYSVTPLIQVIFFFADYQQMSLIYEKYKIFEKEDIRIEEKEKIDEKITSIVFDNVSYAYGYSLPLLEHIDLTIHHHLWLKGKTGSGKSTLLKLLLGYDYHYTGDIYINQKELRNIDNQSLYRRIGYLNDTPTFLHLSLWDNFLCDDEKKVKKYLKAFSKEELFEKRHYLLQEDGAPLSQGERQIVALIRVLCQEYDVIILDEALSHLDSRLANKVIRFLLKNDEGKIYIFVNHQIKMMNKSVGCAIIDEGRLKGEKNGY